MHKTILTAIVAALLAAVSVPLLASAQGDDQQAAQPKPFTVALWGDLPYTADQATVGVPNMISDMNAANVAFSVFDGDLKNGSSVCNAKIYSDWIARFNALRAPAIYVPGDNEWTDCHRRNNNNTPFDPAEPQPYDNLERLAYIRTTMFASPQSFGQRRIRLEHQGAYKGVNYVENTRWTKDDVVFAGLNIPGSDNNRVANVDAPEPNSYRTRDQRIADNAEFAARDEANRVWLHETFEKAKQIHALGVMLVIQADLAFENRAALTGDGYEQWLAALQTEVVAFGRPVVLVHGDSHYFRIDQPLRDASGKLISNFTRVETFGERDPHWVKATIDPRKRELFSFEPQIVPGN